MLEVAHALPQGMLWLQHADQAHSIEEQSPAGEGSVAGGTRTDVRQNGEEDKNREKCPAVGRP